MWYRVRNRRHGDGSFARPAPGTARDADHPDRACQRAASGQRRRSTARRRRRADGQPPKLRTAPDPGLDADFIPNVLQECLDQGGYDDLVPVSGSDGVAWARKLAQREGILTGISGGATFAVAMEIAERAQPGAVILAMLPDTGERYLTTPLFADIPEDMDAEEVALSASTPGFQMG